MYSQTAFKKKLILFLSVIAVLALAYAVSLIIDSVRTGERQSLYTWLAPRLAANADRIIIRHEGEEIEFVKRHDRWFVLSNEREFPARDLRVEDFIGTFTSRCVWPVRYTNPASHLRLGLSQDNASRVTIYADNAVLLDVLVGFEDSINDEVFIRRFERNEARSGNALVSTYVRSSINSWYDLRLIPAADGGRIPADSIQRFSVSTSEGSQVFIRQNRDWIISGIEVENPDMSSIEGYVRFFLNLDGDDFTGINRDDPLLDYGIVVLEMGTGQQINIRFSELDEETNRRYAHVSGTNHVFLLQQWASERFVRHPMDFETR